MYAEKEEAIMKRLGISIRYSCLLVLCSCVLLALLAGCDTGSTASPPTSTASTPPRLDSSPKGPGGLTATPSVTLNCAPNSVTPVSASGWQIYKNGRFPFQFAVPPGWRVGSFTDDSGNDYIVQVFPPGSTTSFGQTGLADPEHFSISVLLVGSPSTYANDPNWHAEAGGITISGVKTTLYDRSSPGCLQVSRGATADIGQHHLTFYVVSIPAKEQLDSMLFESVLQSFTYLGAV
jgi:hypothetical protein